MVSAPGLTGMALRLSGALLGLAVAVSAWGAPVSASLDREELVVGETVTLVLQTNDPQQSLDTDLATLEEDFYLIDQRSETQMSIVNGRQSAVVRQVITLEPRRAGRLSIPGLLFPGGSRTPELTLTVRPAPEPEPGEMPPVFIEVDLEPQEGPYYVHAQLSLKVRIFYQQNLTEAAINPPAPDQASVRLLDEVPYQAERNGQRYRVLERRYAVFPERSGELNIPPMQLTGRLIERPAERLWQPSVRGRRVRVDSEPLILDISPRPPDYQGAFWLPARRIDLSQQISDSQGLRVGEPVTRTVILDAVGLEDHMLEEPVWPEIQNARIYPDKPQGISRDDGQWVLGHREFRYAVVPEEPGELLLPEIQLRWWDTVANRERIAILPEHRVEVLPSATVLPDPRAVAGQGSPGAQGVAGDGGPALRRWQLAAAAFALLWLVTLFLYLRPGRARSLSGPVNGASDDQAAVLLRAFRKACLEGDARAARASLTRWLRHDPALPSSPLRLARRCGDDPLAEQLRSLDATRFGRDAVEDWDGKALWRAFEAWRRTRDRDGAEPEGAAFDLYARAR